MDHEMALPRELAGLALNIMEIFKQEIRGKAGEAAPTLAQFRMLYVIKGGVRQVGKLSEVLGVSQPAASLMVNGLVKDGLLTRTPHPRDRRQIGLKLTAKAEAGFEGVNHSAFKNIHAKLAELPAARKKALALQLREISALLSP